MLTGYDLKEGKKYLRRNGTLTAPLERFYDDDLYDPDSGYYYTDLFRNGNLVYSGDTHDFDIVAEHTCANTKEEYEITVTGTPTNAGVNEKEIITCISEPIETIREIAESVNWDLDETDLVNDIRNLFIRMMRDDYVYMRGTIFHPFQYRRLYVSVAKIAFDADDM